MINLTEEQEIALEEELMFSQTVQRLNNLQPLPRQYFLTEEIYNEYLINWYNTGPSLYKAKK